MTEHESGYIVTNIDGVFIGESHMGTAIENIPSEADGDTGVLDIQWANGDAYITLRNTDSDRFKYLPSMRFREFAGGPNLSMVGSILSSLSAGFRENKGQAITREPYLDEDERIKSFNPVEAQIGAEEDPFELRVTNITDDDDEIRRWTKFMDIVVGKDGNVSVTMRNSEYETEQTVMFKSKENGGKFPIMADVFSRIARVLADTPRAY